MIAPAAEVREQHRFDVATLERYLNEHIAGFRGPLEVRQFRGGQSNPTYHFRVCRGQELAGPLARATRKVPHQFPPS